MTTPHETPAPRIPLADAIRTYLLMNQETVEKALGDADPAAMAAELRGMLSALRSYLAELEGTLAQGDPAEILQIVYDRMRVLNSPLDAVTQVAFWVGTPLDTRPQIKTVDRIGLPIDEVWRGRMNIPLAKPNG